MVATGFSQKPVVDFREIYAPDINHGTLRFVLGLVGHHRVKMLQVDVTSAFLEEYLQEELYIAQPECFLRVPREKRYALTQGALWSTVNGAGLE